MVYDGIRLRVIALPDEDQKIDILQRRLKDLSSRTDRHGFRTVRSTKDLRSLETSYTPRIMFHLCISSCLRAQLNRKTMASLKLLGVHSVCFSHAKGEDPFEEDVMDLLKDGCIVDLSDLQKEPFVRMLDACADTAYIHDLDLLHVTEAYSNSSEALEALVAQGGVAGLSFRYLHRLKPPMIVEYAEKIKRLVDAYGNERFCIVTGANDLGAHRNNVSPLSLLRTELLRLGMSDADLDGIFFQTAYRLLQHVV